MPIESTSSRTSTLVFWIALLTLAALALGAGTFVLARRSLERAATAELSFNPDAASFDHFALTHSDHPAVTAAQSILNDTVVLDVLRQTGDSPADTAVATAEFRSRIEFKEPSLETLQLRYRDRDPQRACTVSNAVATEIEEWTPPAPTPAASKPAVKAHRAAPGVRQDPLAPAYSKLADLEGRLAGLDERLGVLAGERTSADQPLYPVPLNAEQAARRRSLEAQLAEALRKRDDLGARSAGDNPDTATAEGGIAELQHELAAFPLPASGSSRRSATTGTASNLAQLRVQRRDLVNEIAAETRSIVRLRARGATATTADQPKPTPAPPAEVAPAAAAISEWQNPFSIAHRASLAPRILAQPAWLALGVSALFSAAAAFGIFLYWRRETWMAHGTDALGGGRAFVLIPPAPVAETVAAPQPIASRPEAGLEPVATEPVAEREPIASEPDVEWESVAREPEGEWEPDATEPAQSTGEGVEAPLVPGTPISEEVTGPPEAAQPADPVEPPETAPDAADELVHREAETTEMPEAERPKALAELMAESAAASAQADEPSAIRADEIEGGRISFVDPGRGDAEWSARILQALDRTLIGQRPEAEHRGETLNRTARKAPDKSSDAADDRATEEPRSRESGRE